MFLALGVFYCFAAAQAQELEFPISPTPVGSGARAAGMADAFVAVADDATAASWNPAGLAQLERPEISVVGSFNGLVEKFLAAPTHPEFESTQSDANFDVNFLSFTYPIPGAILGRHVTLSLSYQQKFDLSRRFDVNVLRGTTLSNGLTLLDDQNYTFRQNGSLSTITPAFAIELTPRLSVGLSTNFWRDSLIEENEFTQTFRRESATSLNGGPPVLSSRVTTDTYRNVSGENFVAGLLWNVNERWNVGLRYDSAFKAKTDFEEHTNSSSSGTSDIAEERRLSFPATYSAGVSWRANDRLTLAFSGSFTDWDAFYIRRADGTRFSLIDASELDGQTAPVNFKVTRTFRLGTEYVFIPKIRAEELPLLWSLRSGLFYDEEPASGRSTYDSKAPATGDPDSFYGFTAGVGLLAKQRINIDLAYQFRYGNNVNSDYIRGMEGFSEDVVQHRVLLSVVIYF